MNSNRNVLRPTHNRLPLKDVLINKTKICTNSSLQQQENCFPTNSRPILTATRSIKKFLKENDDDNQMLISPMVTTINKVFQKQTVFNENKTREQLEQDLYEL